jgi:hypothetical protein
MDFNFLADKTQFMFSGALFLSDKTSQAIAQL